jgi:hypothetical protein
MFWVVAVEAQAVLVLQAIRNHLEDFQEVPM